MKLIILDCPRNSFPYMEHVTCITERLHPVLNTSTGYDETNLRPKPSAFEMYF